MFAHRQRQSKLGAVNSRIWLVSIVFTVLIVSLLGRFFYLQIIQYDIYASLAQGQQEFQAHIAPNRGEIFLQDKQGESFPVALNGPQKYVYVVPNDIQAEDREGIIQIIHDVLGISKESLTPKVYKENDPFEPIVEYIDDENAAKLIEPEYSGLVVGEKISRYYPAQNLASHVVGFLGFRQGAPGGQYGVEGYYEDILNGETNSVSGLRGVLSKIQGISSDDDDQKIGHNLVLTIDQNIQFAVEKEIQMLMEKYSAKAASIIVLDPTTGKILSLANAPSFNPNTYAREESYSVFINDTISSLYEPGSVIKAFTVAAAVNEQVVSPATTFTDLGYRTITDYTIRNANEKVYGLQTVSQILEQSINTGAIYVQERIGQEQFFEYMKKFGFDTLTGIDLVGEVPGDLANLESKRPINYATASFGQGVAMTPMHIAAALGSLANGGKIMRPYVVDKQVDPSGELLKQTKPSMVRQVLSESAAGRVTSMLVSTVDIGQSKNAGVKGYSIAGKTGTAQVPKRDGRGYSEETNHTYMGYAPAFDPKFCHSGKA